MVRPLIGTMARWFLLLLSGCSLAITGPSPDRPHNKAPTCDTSKGLVALDGVLAATMSVVGLSVAAGNDGSAAIAPLIVAGIFTASAIHGNHTVDACIREQGNYESEMASRTPLPDESERPMVAAQGAPGAAGIAMQPAVSLPSVSGPLPPQQLAPPQPQQPPQQPPPPPPPQQQSPAPRPAPAASAPSDDAWAAFWKEVP
jgi:hypothetical protein